MARRAGTAVGDFLTGEIFHLADRCTALHVPKGVHTCDLSGRDLDRRLLYESADHRQRPRAQADLSVAGNNGLHIFTAAAREDGIHVDIIFFVETLLMGDVNRQRDGKQNAVWHHNDKLRARGCGPCR